MSSKTLLPLVAGAILCTSAATHAEGEKNNVFGINPLGVIFDVYSGDYARFIQDGKAEIDVPFFFWQPLDELTMFSIGAKYRLHLKGQPEGPFAGGGVGVGYVKWEYKTTWDGSETEDITGVTVTPLAELGYRWIWGNGFTLAPSLELGYGIGKVESSDGDVPTTDPSGFQWSLNLGLGWNF